MLTDQERTTLEDLELLAEAWGHDAVRERDVRNASGILRRLLIDNGGSLARVAKDLGRPLAVLAPVNAQTIDALAGLATVYVCGNTTVGGVTIATSAITRGNARQPNFEDEHPDERQSLTLGQFKNQTCLSWMGHRISREALIKYVANKLGGVHFDDRRNSLTDIALDAIRHKVNFVGFDGVYFELLATGRFIRESPSILEFAETLRSEQ